MARFRREVQVLASPNHPNMRAIYGLDDASGTQFLVLELIEGPTLAAPEDKLGFEGLKANAPEWN
jgi:hypothetical protein